MRLTIYALLWFLGACARPAPVPGTGFPATRAARDSLHRVVRAADSISLERTECYGTCPAYRVVLARSGRVRFTARNQYAVPLARYDSVDSGKLEGLATELLFMGFTGLPALIGRDGIYCGPWRTDHPSVTITLYAPGFVKRVEDDHGCPWAPYELRRLQEAIDRTVGLSRSTQSAPKESLAPPA